MNCFGVNKTLLLDMHLLDIGVINLEHFVTVCKSGKLGQCYEQNEEIYDLKFVLWFVFFFFVVNHQVLN